MARSRESAEGPQVYSTDDLTQMKAWLAYLTRNFKHNKLISNTWTMECKILIMKLYGRIRQPWIWLSRIWYHSAKKNRVTEVNESIRRHECHSTHLCAFSKYSLFHLQTVLLRRWILSTSFPIMDSSLVPVMTLDICTNQYCSTIMYCAAIAYNCLSYTSSCEKLPAKR